MIKPLFDAKEKDMNRVPEQLPFKWNDLDIEKPVSKNSQKDEVDEGENPQDSHVEEKKKSSLEQIVEERLKQVEDYLERSKKEAEIIHEKARNKGFEEGRRTGYATGLKEGLEEGKNDGYLEYKEKIEELEDSFSEFLNEAEKAKQKMLENYLDDLKEIALVIGEKIVKTSLRSNSNVVERMILAATEKLKKSAWAKIYIADSKEEGKSVQADQKFLKELSYLSDHIKIVIMDGMEPGTCIIERPDEIIDISVGTQLENIREIMNNAKL